jgi:hypothetical protein
MQNQTSIETQDDEEEILQPKNVWEIYKWAIFEPQLLQDYDDQFIWGERLKDRGSFWKPILINSLIVTILCLLVSFIPVFFFSADMLEPKLAETWDSLTLLDRYLAWLRYASKGLTIGLYIVLLFGLLGEALRGLFGMTRILVFNIMRGLIFCLVFGLSGGFMFGFRYSLSGGLATGLATSLATGLAMGLGLGLLFGFGFGLSGGLMFVGGGLVAGLVIKFKEGLAEGLEGGIEVGGFTLSFCFAYFRMPFLFFYHLIQFLKKYNLRNNPYYLDSLVWTPILFLDKKLIEESYENPQEGQDFVTFLFRRRKFQRALALQIQHASMAGFWKQNRLKPIILEKEPVILEDKEGKKYTPSQAWFDYLEELKTTLIDFYKETSLSQKVNYIKKIQETLSSFIRQTQAESPLWNKYYLLTLPLWEKSAKEEHDRLKIQLENEQPFGENIYKDNVKLTPENQSVFFGRKALQAELKQKVQESTTLPLFLIQGQRRTGKSSLISFLSEYLGETGFAIVSYDMQGQSPKSIPDWLSALLKETQRIVKESAELPILPESWVSAWQVVSERLLALAQARQKRIILAIDEYEILHDRLFQQDTAQAADLLGAMRGFSQQQNQVVFLFAGAAYFTELKNPNWNEYFVQANLLKVDYLNESDTNKLIDAYPALTYATEVRQKMYALTNGHPALLQKILYEIVTQANILQVRQIDMNMLEDAIKKKVLIQQNGVIDIFWGEFCKNRNLRGTVFQLLAGQTEGYDKKAIFQLEEHGFILRREDKFVFRVPLFEQWLRKFAEVVD